MLSQPPRRPWWLLKQAAKAVAGRQEAQKAKDEVEPAAKKAKAVAGRREAQKAKGDAEPAAKKAKVAA
eukprot:gene22727-29888_t